MSEEIQRTTYMYSKMQQYYKGGMCFKMVLPCANTNNSWSNLLIYAFFTLINIPIVHVHPLGFISNSFVWKFWRQTLSTIVRTDFIGRVVWKIKFDWSKVNKQDSVIDLGIKSMERILKYQWYLQCSSDCQEHWTISENQLYFTWWYHHWILSKSETDVSMVKWGSLNMQ